MSKASPEKMATAGKILTKIAAYDTFFVNPSPATVLAWAEALTIANIDEDLALEGVSQMFIAADNPHFRATPGVLIAQCRQIRQQQRLAARDDDEVENETVGPFDIETRYVKTKVTNDFGEEIVHTEPRFRFCWEAEGTDHQPFVGSWHLSKIDALREGENWLVNGQTLPTPPDRDKALADHQERLQRVITGFDAPEDTQARDYLQTLADSPLRVECPWCRAQPGYPCKIPHTQQKLAKSRAHPSRGEAAEKARNQQVNA